MLYQKLLNKSLKIVGVWKKAYYTDYNIEYAFRKIGQLHLLAAPVSSKILNFSKEQKDSFGKNIYSLVESVKPDLIFCYLRNRWINPEHIYKLREFGIPLVNMSLDDSHKFKLIYNLAPAFDLNLTTTKTAVPLYTKHNAKALYFPGGANPDLLKTNVNKKDLDICFVGKRYGNRSSIYKALLDKKYKIAFRGLGWAGGSINFEGMKNLYARSKIVLGFSKTSSSRSKCNLKGRDLEVTGSKSFYLCEKNEELENWFIKDKELVFWEDINDLLTKINFYLQHEDLRSKIAENGYLKTNSNYTWVKWFEKITKLF